MPMSTTTKIQWCDSTVNPVMGCGGCELFPSAKQVLDALDQSVGASVGWPTGWARKVFSELSRETYDAIDDPQPAMQRAVTTTNIWHLRERFQDVVNASFGSAAEEAARRVIEEQVTCYAAKLHLNKGTSIVNPGRQLNNGYAPVFSRITQYQGRMEESAKLSDLLMQTA